MFEIYLKLLFPKGSISSSYERIRRGCYNYMIKDIYKFVFFFCADYYLLFDTRRSKNAD